MTTLEDAILAAERADACDKFAKFGMKMKHAPAARNSGPVPMELG